MRILADENVTGLLVAALRAAGLDVVWIAETHQGIDDLKVLDLAIETERHLLTFDKRLVSSIVSNAHPKLLGVIFLRLPMGGLQGQITKTLEAIADQRHKDRCVTIVKSDGVRVRRLDQKRDP